MNLLSALTTYRAADRSVCLPDSLPCLCRHADLLPKDHRPIIFVAHSLGGLVVKDALLLSRTSPETHLRRIFDSTRGILFLGTPHLGASLAPVAEKLAKMIGMATRTNLKILKVLRKDSEVLSRIQTDFYSLLRSQQQAGRSPWDITSFYEELPMAGIGEVVPKESAVLPGYPAIGIHRDHRDIARFSTSEDPGYVSIVGELRRWIEYIQFPGSRGDRGLQCKEDSNACNGTRSGNGDIETQNVGSGSVMIWGNVKKSIVMSGTQTIQGNLSFRR
ncbi:hypothetical protein F5Y19DRAFT_451220 [Xylariaceae sp. FL1651]|nr:hypothetical protein F5Y19DRAFT_451220 [Xylariaceae sp. FL1651]